MSADEVVVPGLPPLDWALKPGRAYVTQSSLFLEANGSTDWFCSPSGDVRLNARPLGFSAPGTFALSAKASIKGERSVYDAPALIVWRLSSPKKHWAKLCFEQAPALSPSPSPSAGDEEVNGAPGLRDTGIIGPVSVVNHSDASDDASHGSSEGEALYLRVSRTASSSFAFHSSSDGRKWDLLRIFQLGGEGEIRAGFLAQCPTGSGCECRFEEIRLGQPPRNLRDGT